MRLLIVEDDRKLAEFVARGLRAERFAVDIAADGREGQRYLEAYRYDLLILDLMLPQLSGGELLRRVRQTQSQLPVLVLTARDATDDKVSQFEAGADDYLTKPFDFAELVVRVKALLRRAPLERAEVLRCADLELNRHTQQVRRGGQRIDLTAKEFAVLEYLMSSPGRVFSRTMILEHVWDQSFEGVTNIVDVYVRYVRRKVDEPFLVKLIHTVRGVGYCLRAADQIHDASEL
jgi:two-component system copper resistance phosphate regulon response regulator CusR